MSYAFGDSLIAAHRLQTVAEVFAETSRSFLLDAAVNKPSLVVDLGCGPGHSTHLLADALQGRRIVGLDNSEHFIALAKQTETERVSFLLHDVTSVPFPVGPSDMLYCRFLLTWLKEAKTMLIEWASQLQLKGLLLIEEVEYIHTENPVFSSYLQIVDVMLKAQSNNLYIGPTLRDVKDPAGLRRRLSRLRLLPVSDRRAAAMFLLNIQSWKSHPFIQANYSPSDIKRIQEGLEILAQNRGDETRIEWGLRQMVFEHR